MNALTRGDTTRPPERTHMSKRQTGRPDVHKAPGRSQLSKSDTGALGPNDPTRTDALTRHDTARPPERTHMGANGKRPARTCTRHPGGRNLANLTRAPSGQTNPPERKTSPGTPTRTDALTRHDTARPPKRTHMGANGKRAARTCTNHPGGHNLANLTRAPSGHTTRPERTPSPGTTRRARPNGRTWEQTANGPPGRAQGTRAVTT